MGKKHRRGDRAPAQPFCLAAPPPKTAKQAGKELRAALRAMAEDTLEQARIDRINALPFSDPENAHKIGATFDPIDNWMDSVAATGEIDVTGAGLAILRTSQDDPAWYPLAASLRVVCDAFAAIAAERGLLDPGAALRQLARKVEVDMPLFQRDIDAGRASVAAMREIILELTPAQFSAHTIALRVRAAMDARRAA